MDQNFASGTDRDKLPESKLMFFGLGNHLGLFSHLPDEHGHQQWHVQQGCDQLHEGGHVDC